MPQQRRKNKTDRRSSVSENCLCLFIGAMRFDRMEESPQTTFFVEKGGAVAESSQALHWSGNKLKQKIQVRP